MTKMTGFLSLLTKEQQTQILKNPQDFDLGDPNYLLGSTDNNKGKSNETKTSKDS